MRDHADFKDYLRVNLRDLREKKASHWNKKTGINFEKQLIPNTLVVSI